MSVEWKKAYRTWAEKRFFEWHNDSIGVSVRAVGGSYGGGSEVLIEELTLTDAEHRRAVSIGNGQLHNINMTEITNPLDCMHDAQAILEGGADGIEEHRTAAEDAEGTPASPGVVRRLTPLEATRLQGFPDGWVNVGDWVDSTGKHRKDADSPKYKALGNSVALPFWVWLARRISAQYERPATMGSLFDGIGGFPLAFSRCGTVPVWASEIEEFPIAVTKKHFPEPEDL